MVRTVTQNFQKRAESGDQRPPDSVFLAPDCPQNRTRISLFTSGFRILADSPGLNRPRESADRISSSWKRLAVGVPHLAIRRLDIPGKPAGIHQRGSTHPLTRGSAQFGQAREVVGQAGGNLNVLLWCLSDQFRQADVP
jgi:hypothetical protein